MPRRHASLQTPSMLLQLHLGEAKVLAARGDGGIELLSEVLVTLVLWKVEFCERKSVNAMILSIKGP